MKYIFLCLILLLCACGEPAILLENNEVFVSPNLEKMQLDLSDREKPMHLSYTIDIKTPDTYMYCYFLYRTVSKVYFPIKYKEVEKNELIHYELIERGRLSDLKKSDLNGNYLTLGIDYSFSLDTHQLDNSDSYTSMSQGNSAKVSDIRGPVSFHFLRNNSIESKVLNDVGLVVYKLPWVEVESTMSYEKFEKMQQWRLDNHEFDYSSYFESKDYFMYLQYLNGFLKHRGRLEVERFVKW